MSIKRAATALALSVIAILTTTAVAASPAQAVTCYGGAITVDKYLADGTGVVGPYTTSARCRDINMRMTTNNQAVTACVDLVAVAGSCNGWKTIDGTTWRTIATDVRDGSRFYVRLSHVYQQATVTFQLAY